MVNHFNKGNFEVVKVENIDYELIAKEIDWEP